MLFVLPETSATRPTSYFGPRPYEHYPSQDYYPYPSRDDYRYPSRDYYQYHDSPRFAVPSYPAPQLDYFRQPSAAELEEGEYQRALEVVANHRRRQAEKEAAIRRQQQAEAHRQRYFAALAAELEQRRQEELLAARRVELIRSQQARARLVAAERQRALQVYLQQLKGAEPVCHVFMLVVDLILIDSSPQIARQQHVVKRRPLADALKQRLAAESDTDITEPIRNLLSSLEPRPAQSENSEDASEGATKLIEDLLSSIFPGLAFHTQPQPAPPTEQAEPSVSDKGKGKARAVDAEEPRKPVSGPESTGDSFADIIRHVMELSKSAPAPQSSDKAGPSGTSSSPAPSAAPAVTKGEQSQIDRAIALSSVEHIQSNLTKLQTDFVLPAELDHYTPSADDRDETASVSSTSSSDLTKLIPYTTNNKPVYKYENELSGLLVELDRIDSHGDAEVREKRKEVVKAVEKALGGVERAVGEAVEKRLSLVSAIIPATDETLKGFDVDEDVTEEATPVLEQVDTPAVVDDVAVPEPSTSVQQEEPLPESDNAVVSDGISDLIREPVPTGSDVEASTSTITPASVGLMSVTEAEPTNSQAQADAPETVDTLLLPEGVSLPSQAEKPQEISSDSDEEALVLDSDAEKSDWSEVEH